MTPRLVAVLALEDLPPGEMRAVEVDGTPVVLARTPAGEVHALHDACPHWGVKLSKGELVPRRVGANLTSRTDFLVRCPAHRWDFSLRSGQLCSNHLKPHEVRVFRTVVEDGAIFVESQGELRWTR